MYVCTRADARVFMKFFIGVDALKYGIAIFHSEDDDALILRQLLSCGAITSDEVLILTEAQLPGTSCRKRREL